MAIVRGSSRGSRSKAPPAATSERLTSGIPRRAPASRDDQIARQRDLQPARHRKPLDRGDQGLARGTLGDARKASVARVGPLARDERLEVHAGAEALAGAGEHADGQPRVVVELVERVGDSLRDGCVDRVALIGAVDRDQEDPVPTLGQDGFVVAHAANNFRSGWRSPRSTVEVHLDALDAPRLRRAHAPGA